MSLLDPFCRSRPLHRVAGAVLRMVVTVAVMLPPVPAFAGDGISGNPRYGRPADLTVQLAVDQQTLLSPAVQTGFPRLGANFQVLGPSTSDYNCIAHSLGIHDRWVNPVTGPESNPLAPFDKLYASQGYRRRLDLNLALERGKQKVVVYATLNPDATIAEITHAALQEKDGTWTSKLGRLALIRHQTPEQLRGTSYGLPVAVYEREAK